MVRKYHTHHNSIVYASETIDGLPSISEGVNELVDGSRQRLVIVGGPNQIGATLSVPAFGTGVSGVDRVKIETGPETVLTQPNGAEVSPLVETNGARAEFDVTVDGNKANQTGAVTGVEVNGEQGFTESRVVALDCTTGLHVVGNAESNRYYAYVNGCDTGVLQEDDANGNTPDENVYFVSGHNGDGPFFRTAGSASNSAKLIAGVESTSSGPTVQCSNGTVVISGVFRGASTHGIEADGARIHVNGAFIGSFGKSGSGNGIFFHGGSERSSVHGVDISMGSQAGTTGIRFGDAAETSRATACKVHGVECRSPDQYAIDFDYTHGCKVSGVLELGEGASTTDAIRFGDSHSDEVALTRQHAGFVSMQYSTAETRPLVRWTGGFNDTDRTDIQTPAAGHIIEYNYTDNLPNYHNGTDWTLPDGTVT